MSSPNKETRDTRHEGRGFVNFIEFSCFIIKTNAFIYIYLFIYSNRFATPARPIKASQGHFRATFGPLRGHNQLVFGKHYETWDMGWLWSTLGPNLAYECEFGVTLASLLTCEIDFGTILGSLWADFRIWGWPWGHFGPTLGVAFAFESDLRPTLASLSC